MNVGGLRAAPAFEVPMRRSMRKIVPGPKKPLQFRQKVTRLVLVGLGLWVLWILFAGDTSLVELWKLKRENGKLRAEIAELERRLTELDREEKNLEDPEYLEKIAREEYGMIRDGEICYRLVRMPPEKGQGAGKKDPEKR